MRMRGQSFKIMFVQLCNWLLTSVELLWIHSVINQNQTWTTTRKTPLFWQCFRGIPSLQQQKKEDKIWSSPFFQVGECFSSCWHQSLSFTSISSSPIQLLHVLWALRTRTVWESCRAGHHCQSRWDGGYWEDITKLLIFDGSFELTHVNIHLYAENSMLLMTF